MYSAHTTHGDFDPQVIVIIGAIILLLGFIFLMVAIIIYVAAKNSMTKCTVSTQAEVLTFLTQGQHFHDQLNRRVLATPYVRYYVNGMEVRSHSNLYMRPCPYRIGEFVPIRYNPLNPQQMVLEKMSTTKLIFIMFMAFGVALSLVGIPILIVAFFM